jgi:hypothetical protein
MKQITQIAAILVLMFSANLSAQETTAQETAIDSNEVIIKVEMAISYASSAMTSQWFTGVKQTLEFTNILKETQTGSSALQSKKEMYLQSGMSNKTLLIRSLLKRADNNVRAIA